MPTFLLFRTGQRLQDKDVQRTDASLLESRVVELIRFKPMEPIENPYVPSTSHVQSKLKQVRAKKFQEEQDKELEDEKERRSCREMNGEVDEGSGGDWDEDNF